MKKRRFLSALTLLIALLLAVTSCASAPPAAKEVLSAMCKTQKSLPAGRFYVRSAPEDGEGLLSSDLFAATFGTAADPPELELITDAALYLCYSDSVELGVLLCQSADAAASVARLCRHRLDLLSRYRIPGSEESANPSVPSAPSSALDDSGLLTVRGRWVVYCLTPDPDAAMRAFRRSL